MNVHARLLSLCDGCGRVVRLVQRTPPHRTIVDVLLGRRPRPASPATEART